MTSKEEDLVRWCFEVAGFSTTKLSHDFECPVAEIQRIVSSDLARVMSPREPSLQEAEKALSAGQTPCTHGDWGLARMVLAHS